MRMRKSQYERIEGQTTTSRDGRDEIRGILGMFLVSTILTVGFLVTCLAGAHSKPLIQTAKVHAAASIHQH